MIYKFKKLIFEKIITKTYTNNFIQKGPTPNGVFWNSQFSQELRFELSLKHVISKKEIVSIADIGCGYGALYNFIKKKKYKNVLYSGYDINKKMIEFCKSNFPNCINFSIGNTPINKVDYCIFIGTFNLCFTDDYNFWENYIFENLLNNWKQCKKGIILNISTKFNGNIENKIFYANENFEKRLFKKFGKVEKSQSKFIDNNSIYKIMR